jgi:hypothetical protein
MLTILAFYWKPGGGPNWDVVADLMGKGYTSGSVSQHYTKTMVKRDAFTEATERYGSTGATRGGGTSSAPGTPSKKRKSGIQEAAVIVKKQKVEE